MKMNFDTNLSLMENISNYVSEVCKKYGQRNISLRYVGNGNIYGVENGVTKFMNGLRIFTAKSGDADKLFRPNATFAEACKIEEYLKDIYSVRFDYGDTTNISTLLMRSRNNPNEFSGGFDADNGTWYHIMYDNTNGTFIVYCNIITEMSKWNTQRYLKVHSLEKLKEIA